MYTPSYDRRSARCTWLWLRITISCMRAHGMLYMCRPLIHVRCHDPCMWMSYAVCMYMAHPKSLFVACGLWRYILCAVAVFTQTRVRIVYHICISARRFIFRQTARVHPIRNRPCCCRLCPPVPVTVSAASCVVTVIYHITPQPAPRTSHDLLSLPPGAIISHARSAENSRARRRGSGSLPAPVRCWRDRYAFLSYSTAS